MNKREEQTLAGALQQQAVRMGGAVEVNTLQKSGGGEMKEGFRKTSLPGGTGELYPGGS